MLGIGALFLLFVLLYSQRVASQSCETLGELLHHPENSLRSLRSPLEALWKERIRKVTGTKICNKVGIFNLCSNCYYNRLIKYVEKSTLTK